MGLIHPTDLDAWQRWHASLDPLRHVRRLRATLRPGDGPQPLHLVLGGPSPDVLVALDSRAASSRAALLDPLHHLPSSRVAVLAPFPLDDLVPDLGATHRVSGVDELHRALPGVRVALSAGNYLPAGALAHQLVTPGGGRSIVVQHGLLTPHAPPLPAASLLAAWSASDAAFWIGSRTDVSVEVVGSQLLHHAAQQPEASVDPHATPVFLGQLHGAELPRTEMARVSEAFCRATGAKYRPHPSESDLRSRLTHARWAKRGVPFETSGRPLDDLAAPIVGVFSTGVLEAAAAGRPAWVFHPDPPNWVLELWQRYDLARWGREPTPRPVRPAIEPARRIADLALAAVDRPGPDPASPHP
jgi:hypothetical protein